jgi:hypothetical protein
MSIVGTKFKIHDEKEVSNLLDNFIEHVLKNKINLAFWYMTEYGKLEFHNIAFVHPQNIWMWQCDLTTKKTTECNIKKKLKSYLYDYSINWMFILSKTKPILLTYPYTFENIVQHLEPSYEVPVQRTIITDKPMSSINFEILNNKMHNEYLKKYKRFVAIKKGILEQLKTINYEKYELINSRIDLEVEPEQIVYLHKVVSDNEASSEPPEIDELIS